MTIVLVEPVGYNSVRDGDEHPDGLRVGLEGIVTIDNLLPLVTELPCSWRKAV